jgi:hypothetical protein
MMWNLLCNIRNFFPLIFLYTLRLLSFDILNFVKNAKSPVPGDLPSVSQEVLLQNDCSNKTPSCVQPLGTVHPTYRTGTMLPSKHPILCIFSTYIWTEFLNMLHNLCFFSLQNAVYFILLPCLVPVLFTFDIQGVLKLKCQIPVPKG